MFLTIFLLTSTASIISIHGFHLSSKRSEFENGCQLVHQRMTTYAVLFTATGEFHTVISPAKVRVGMCVPPASGTCTQQTLRSVLNARHSLVDRGMKTCEPNAFEETPVNSSSVDPVVVLNAAGEEVTVVFTSISASSCECFA